MTNKEKYKQAFSVLHSSDRQFLEVEEMMKSVYFSFSVIFSFLAIFQVLQWSFLIFHLF